MIYHAARLPEWDDSAPAYEPADFEADGFVHCSTAAQLEAAVNRFRGDEPELVLLVLDEAALGEALRWEPGSLGERELFPHVHAPIPRPAVRAARRWRRGENGYRTHDVAIDVR